MGKCLTCGEKDVVMKFVLSIFLIGVQTVLWAQPNFEVQKIWDAGEYNAFTDICYFQDQLFVCFREGEHHVFGADGKIRIIASSDGINWESKALLELDGIDLRDPKLAVMPDKRIMMSCGGSEYDDRLLRGWHTRVAFSSNGSDWSMIRQVVGIPRHNWFFRITWQQGVGYVAPSIHMEDPESFTAISTYREMVFYETHDGLNYKRMSRLPIPGAPCEGSVHFNHNQRALILVRNEDSGKRGRVAFSDPPYLDWEVKKLQIRFGGPNMILLPNNRWLVGTREWGNDRSDQTHKTVLFLMDQDGNFERYCELPSGGDTSYPGFAIANGKLFISYYSSHEGKASIYLASMPIDELD